MQWLPINPGYESCLKDESGLRGQAERICFPKTEEEAAQAFSEAEKAGKKLTIQGARTGMAGGAVPNGGWILNLSHLQKLGKAEKSQNGSFCIQAEAGVTLENLCETVRAVHLFYPPSPTESSASLGGMFATGASGPNRWKYGASSRYVREIHWLTPQGRLWKIRRGQYVSQDGILTLPEGEKIPGRGDLIDFLSGSEGLLGAVTQMTLELLPTPGEQWSVIFFFEEENQALSFGEALRTEKIPELVSGEYYDPGTVTWIRNHGNHPLLKRLPNLPEGIRGAVACELEGDGDCSQALMQLLDLFDAHGGREENSWAETGAVGIEKLRTLRHAIPAILHEERNGVGLQGDFQGPGALGTQWARYFTSRLEEIPGAVYGHILDNGLRVVLFEDSDRAGNIMEEFSSFVTKNGGNLRGEYGIGRKKLIYFPKEQDLKESQEIKAAREILDPLERLKRGEL